MLLLALAGGDHVVLAPSFFPLREEFYAPPICYDRFRTAFAWQCIVRNNQGYDLVAVDW